MNLCCSPVTNGWKESAAAEACDGDRQGMGVLHTEQCVHVGFDLRVVPVDCGLGVRVCKKTVRNAKP